MIEDELWLGLDICTLDIVSKELEGEGVDPKPHLRRESFEEREYASRISSLQQSNQLCFGYRAVCTGVDSTLLAKGAEFAVGAFLIDEHASLCTGV